MCPNERWFNSKGVTHFTPTSIFIVCVSSSGSLLAIWPVLHHLTRLYGTETSDTFTVLLECHLQAHVWPHTCLSLAESETRVEPCLLTSARVSPQVTVWLWLRHFRTLVKCQWCSRLIMVMETGVFTHTIVNENTQSWMGFCALSSILGCFSSPGFARFSPNLQLIWISNKKSYLHL